MPLSSQIPVVEKGPAGSRVFAATISDAPERPGGAGLGNIFRKCFLRISPSQSPRVGLPGIWRRTPF